MSFIEERDIIRELIHKYVVIHLHCKVITHLIYNFVASLRIPVTIL